MSTQFHVQVTFGKVCKKSDITVDNTQELIIWCLSLHNLTHKWYQLHYVNVVLASRVPLLETDDLELFQVVTNCAILGFMVKFTVILKLDKDQTKTQKTDKKLSFSTETPTTTIPNPLKTSLDDSHRGFIIAGEENSGKSTLMKILFGIPEKDQVDSHDSKPRKKKISPKKKKKKIS